MKMSNANLVLFFMMGMAISTTNAIIAGRNSSLGQFKYYALVEPNGGRCAGVLISKDFVLTAAHCVNAVDKVIVSLGTLMASEDSELTRQEFTVTKIIVHPQFRPNLIMNDIAILQLSYSATLNDYVQPIQISCEIFCDTFPDYLNVTVVGDGKWNSTDYATTQQYVYLKTIPRFNCGVQDNPFSLVRVKTACAKGDGIQTPCGGDSGAPVTTTIVDSLGFPTSDTRLIGLVSFGAYIVLLVPECDGKAIGFTILYCYVDFIEEKTGLHIC